MQDFDVLPQDRDNATFYVLTASGTIHVMNFKGRPAWTRLPAPGEDALGSGSEKIISQLDEGWRVGQQGYLVCADETYLSGATWHRTATIIRITDDPAVTKSSTVQSACAEGPTEKDSLRPIDGSE
ncbi:hypothetical protein [Marisediminicola sp. LYQ134]|uniref:hypothetical protein n=1 Tax=Marisediminicola sp. LYQ134 TaxID=3391061 RepID=UPI003982DCA6